jgi:hypothetical protein
MVQGARCGATGLKMRDVVSACIEGKSQLVCRECAKTMLGEQEPCFYIKKVK